MSEPKGPTIVEALHQCEELARAGRADGVLIVTVSKKGANTLHGGTISKSFPEILAAFELWKHRVLRAFG